MWWVTLVLLCHSVSQTKAGIAVLWPWHHENRQNSLSHRAMLDWLFYRQNPSKTKMASNNVINTELVGSIVYGLKFISRLMPENVFMWTSGQRNVLASKVYFSNKIVKLVTFKWPWITPGFLVTLLYPVWLYLINFAKITMKLDWN